MNLPFRKPHEAPQHCLQLQVTPRVNAAVNSSPLLMRCRWLRRIDTDPEAAALFARFGSSHAPRATKDDLGQLGSPEASHAGLQQQRPGGAGQRQGFRRGSGQLNSGDAAGPAAVARGEGKDAAEAEAPDGRVQGCSGLRSGGALNPGASGGGTNSGGGDTNGSGGAVGKKRPAPGGTRGLVPPQKRQQVVGSGAAGSGGGGGVRQAAATAKPGKGALRAGGAATAVEDDWTAIEVAALRWRVTLHGEEDWDVIREDFRLRNRCSAPPCKLLLLIPLQTWHTSSCRVAKQHPRWVERRLKARNPPRSAQECGGDRLEVAPNPRGGRTGGRVGTCQLAANWRKGATGKLNSHPLRSCLPRALLNECSRSARVHAFSR